MNMGFRDFLRSLRILQHFVDQEKLTQKLSESYPFRRSAQITAYFMQKGREKVEEIKESEATERLREKVRENMSQADQQKDASTKRVNSFFNTFLTELEKEWDKEKKNLGSGSQSDAADKENKKN